MAQDVPSEFIDTITMDVMDDPVITCDGQTYDRKSIEEWLKVRNTSPLTGAPLPSKKLTPNISLRKMIDEFKLRTGQSQSSVTNNQSQLPRQLVKISGTAEAEATKALVYRSYGKQEDTDESILITDVYKIENDSLSSAFRHFQSTHSSGRTLRLFHGTKKQPVHAIALEGFKIPVEFTRTDSAGETGLLTFGKALYFAFDACKAVEFGSRQVLVCDVALGNEIKKKSSHHSLTEEKMLSMNKHSIVTSDEVAVYNKSQALPLYAVTYSIVKEDGSQYDPAAAYVGKTAATLDCRMLISDLDGRARCRESALRALGNICRDEQAAAVAQFLCGDDWADVLPKLGAVLSAPDQTQASLWLCLRVLWNSAFRHRRMQAEILRAVDPPRLVCLLQHWSESIQLRAAGVVLNLCSQAIEHRDAFWRAGAVPRLVDALKAAVANDNRELQEVSLSALANLSFHPEARRRWTLDSGLLAALLEVVEPLMDSDDRGGPDVSPLARPASLSEPIRAQPMRVDPSRCQPMPADPSRSEPMRAYPSRSFESGHRSRTVLRCATFILSSFAASAFLQG
jgi:hypothetical protein